MRQSHAHFLLTIVAVAIAVALTYFFWTDWWSGSDLIGGDLYTYAFPQKQFYAESLKAGGFPLWNPLVGHGYPLVAESQTGAFSPFHLVAYRLWDVQSAYAVVQLSHYALAFLFTWLYARSLNFGMFASLFAGLIFVYGWFPPRSSLEWAIITGAWLPAALWCSERYWQSGRSRFLVLLTLALAAQMLAGHFHLAFITQVTVVGYNISRAWLREPSGETASDVSWRRALPVAAAVLLAFGLAAVQLVPTMELKSLSQRSAVGHYYDPAYGLLPPGYLVQQWGERAAALVNPGHLLHFQHMDQPRAASDTNRVEASLYFGLIPLAMFVWGLVTRGYRRRVLWLWVFFGVLAACYSFGWMMPVARHMPGFSFFRGAGRYGIVTVFAAAVLAGAVLDNWTRRCTITTSALLAALVMAPTFFDLMWMGGKVRDAEFLSSTPLDFLHESPIRRILKAESQPVRLFSRGANLPTLLGVASVPEYLGLGPQEYFDPETAIPQPPPFDTEPTPEQIRWLQAAGVSHVLSFHKLDPQQWPVVEVFQGFDPFLHGAWGRHVSAPMFLYRFQGSRGRVAWMNSSESDSASIQSTGIDEVTIEAVSAEGGRLVLTELLYPGWEVTIDGTLAEPVRVGGMYRGVDVPAGEHIVRWTYRPRSVKIGAVISLVAVVLLMGLCIVRFLKMRRLTAI